jgi:CxxC motif-containing protein
MNFYSCTNCNQIFSSKESHPNGLSCYICEKGRLLVRDNWEDVKCDICPKTYDLMTLNMLIDSKAFQIRSEEGEKNFMLIKCQNDENQIHSLKMKKTIDKQKDQEILKKLQELSYVAADIEISLLSDIFETSDAEIIEFLLEWNEILEFSIDYQNNKLFTQDVSAFIQKLDDIFEKWNYNEKNKIGKNENPEQTIQKMGNFNSKVDSENKGVDSENSEEFHRENLNEFFFNLKELFEVIQIIDLDSLAWINIMPKSELIEKLLVWKSEMSYSIKNNIIEIADIIPFMDELNKIILDCQQKEKTQEGKKIESFDPNLLQYNTDLADFTPSKKNKIDLSLSQININEKSFIETIFKANILKPTNIKIVAGNIVRIGFYQKSLGGVLSKIARLINLTEIYIIKCDLGEYKDISKLFDSLHKIESLKKLVIIDCSLESLKKRDKIIPTHIEELNLSGNEELRILDPWIDYVPSLMKLIISDTGIIYSEKPEIITERENLLKSIKTANKDIRNTDKYILSLEKQEPFLTLINNSSIINNIMKNGCTITQVEPNKGGMVEIQLEDFIEGLRSEERMEGQIIQALGKVKRNIPRKFVRRRERKDDPLKKRLSLEEKLKVIAEGSPPKNEK